jgi:TolB-like protein/Tfp pilus assembly protein PilF
MKLFNELKRRNVFKVGIAYVIIGWLILQVGEVLAPALLLPDWVNSMLAFFIILGFPLSLFFAWAFEMTPEGLKKEKDVVRDQSITQVTGRKLDFAIIGLLVLALGYFAWDKFITQPASVSEPSATAQDQGHSIAVLPLADMSPGGDHEYFSDGLTEELLNILAKIQELQVAGRTSSFAFKGQNQDLREIGKQLNVENILEGSVRKDEARNKVRITLQLINAENGYHLWSETYDRDLDDIFAIQEEVAHEVARALRITLLGEDEARLDEVATTDLNAYDLYLQARAEMRLAGWVNLDRAEELLQQVLAIDPAYKPARLGLVKNWDLKVSTGAMTNADAYSRGMPVIDSLLESDPLNSEVHANHAAYLFQGRGDVAGGEAAYQRALELDPRNASAMQSYGRLLFDTGRVEQGVALIDASVEIEPFDEYLRFNQCQVNAYLGNLDTATAACRRVQEISPDGPQGYYGEALAYIYAGNVPQALLGYSRAIEKDPEDYEMIAAMGIFWIALGDIEQARIWLERAEAIGAGQPVPTNSRILLYEYLEQYEQAGELAADALARNMDDRHGTNFFFRRANTAHALRTEAFEKGLEPYRELLPWIFEAELVIPDQAQVWNDDVIFAALLMKKLNPLSERPEALLSWAESTADQYYPAAGAITLPLRLAAINAIRGNEEQAIHHLREAQKFMVQTYWRPAFIDDPSFFGMKGNSEYQTIIMANAAMAEEQRLEARQLLGIDL